MGRFRDAYQETKMKKLEAQQQRIDKQTDKSLNKYGLDVSSASTTAIQQLNAQNIQKIHADLRGNGLIKAGLTFGGSATERAQLGYLSALVEQNWVLLRQNELIIRLLDKQ